MGLSPHLSEKSWGGAGWLEKVGWASDGLIRMAAITGMRDGYARVRQNVEFVHSESGAVEAVSNASRAGGDTPTAVATDVERAK